MTVSPRKLRPEWTVPHGTLMWGAGVLIRCGCSEQAVRHES